MVIAALITMIILTAVACHTHCHLKTPFWKQEELLTPTTHNFIWKELLAYGTCAHSTVRLKTVKFKKTRQTVSPWLKNPASLVRENKFSKSPRHGCIQPTASTKLHLDPTCHSRLMLLRHKRQRAPQFNQERPQSNPMSDSQFPLLLHSLFSIPTSYPFVTWQFSLSLPLYLFTLFFI